ncbi:MAG: ribbon-helix-helix domain-containing protein [Peptostreptococcaceae bacterium]
MEKKRTRFSTSSKTELVNAINKLSEETRLTKTALVDEAIEDLLKKYKKKIDLYK